MDDPRRMVQKYKNSISQLVILIEKGENHISLNLYSNGSVLVSKDRDDIDDEALESINIIVGGKI